ncbi:MarR family transcriptional regulator [Altericroceibacterium spongiae]|uniref:MarR family transcriptional regulator n=1 Tax=Altericroceibacterium spongiae TaxID=2320269 RepID=A0A420EC59_9SPHN|nr:MarR family transcriptional regulator [Altericroceibacterium spongiae]RKF18222.1 MarR family transcriptional regulator [Altericroceibacterium spongiae]
MHDPLPDYPGYALRRAANMAMTELANRLAGIGLRQVDASTMILIEANPGVTGSALARRLDIRRANMVPLLKGLEDAGLIERAPIDGKSLGLNLTSLGRKKLAEARQRIETFEAELLRRVPAEHRAHLVPALNALWQEEEE